MAGKRGGGGGTQASGGGRARASSPYHHGDLRRALLAATLDCIEEAGPDAVTLRGVAARAGVSHAAPYRHFADKEALLAAVAAQGFRALADSIARAATGAEGPTERLVAAACAYVEFARRRPAYFEVMFHGRRRGGPVGEASSVAFAGLVALIEDAQRAGERPAEPPETLAQAAWALVHGLAELATTGRLGAGGRNELARITERAARFLITGMAAAAGRPG